MGRIFCCKRNRSREQKLSCNFLAASWDWKTNLPPLEIRAETAPT